MKLNHILGKQKLGLARNTKLITANTHKPFLLELNMDHDITS